MNPPPPCGLWRAGPPSCLGNRPPLLLAGPTPAGKSDVALILARRLGGEIVSVDSMQVYRGLDVGTAKPSAAEQRVVPHHLIDVVDCHESFDAGKFVALARAAGDGIRARGRLPVLCGGTGLYFKAYLDGLGETPPSDPALRARLERIPLDELLRELEQKDPEGFARIDQKNPRRVVRAVEILRLTGRPPSAQRAPWRTGSSPEADSGEAPAVFVLRREAGDLHARIGARVDRMFAHGLVAETERLLAGGLAASRTALQAIGYRQVVEHLQGQRTLSETIDLVKCKTRQFAKRQMTWYRRQLPVRWLDVAPAETSEAIAERVLGLSQV